MADVLRTSKLGLDLIKQFEGLRLKAYHCSAGVLTIGYGHTSMAGPPQVYPGLTITREEAERIFRDDINKFENGVEKALGAAAAKLTSCQFDAVVSLAYNIGLGAFAKSTVCKRIKEGKLDRVPEAIMWWNKVGGQELKGLTRRRRAEAALWRQDTKVVEDVKEEDFGNMPQEVDEPKPPKEMIQSKTGWIAILGAITAAIAPLKELIEPLKDALTPPVLITLILVSTGCAAFIWWERRRKLLEDRV